MEVATSRNSEHQWSSGRMHRCHRCDPGVDSRLMHLASGEEEEEEEEEKEKEREGRTVLRNFARD